VMSVLALVCDESGATNERLRYVLNMHKAEISDLLKLMVQKGLLETYGHGRGMHYKLPSKSTNVLGANNANNTCTFESPEEMVPGNGASYSASLAANSASSAKKRLSREELKSLIISVSIEDIVKKSGKSTSYIRNVVIPLLLAEKSIVMLFPGTPRNPNQKYRIKE
ncbi:MAG: hypothetical protein SPE79_06250, partial [Sodaliphilus sp.]|nr:hypothetical protein [Sodaliphilus sp.]